MVVITSTSLSDAALSFPSLDCATPLSSSSLLSGPLTVDLHLAVGCRSMSSMIARRMISLGRLLRQNGSRRSRDKMFSFLCMESVIGREGNQGDCFRGNSINGKIVRVHYRPIERHRLGFDCTYCRHMFSCKLVLVKSCSIVNYDTNAPMWLLIHRLEKMACCSSGCSSIVPSGMRLPNCVDESDLCLFCRRNAYHDCCCNCARKTTGPTSHRVNEENDDAEELRIQSSRHLARYPLYTSATKRSFTFECDVMKIVSRYDEALARTFVLAQLAYDSRVFAVRCTVCSFAPSRYDVAVLFPTTSRPKAMFNLQDFLCLNAVPDAELEDTVEEEDTTSTIVTINTVLTHMGFRPRYHREEEHRRCHRREQSEEIAEGLAMLTEWHDEVRPNCVGALQARRWLSAQRLTLQRPGSQRLSSATRSRNIADYLFARETNRSRETL